MIDGSWNAVFQPMCLPGNREGACIFQAIEFVHRNGIVIFTARVAAAGNDATREVETRPAGKLGRRIIHQRVLAGPARPDNHDHRTGRLFAPVILPIVGHATRLP